jgi:hypothetical protein
MPDSVTLATAAFQCVVGTNAASEGHRPGYNGVWSLVPTGAQHSLFVPGIAGLNLEHYFDAWQNGRSEVFFEPRVAPMQLERIGERGVRLHQDATPFWGVESQSTFTLHEPNALGLDFRCTPRRAAFHNGVMGVFWASYLHTPADKAIHFRGRPAAGAAEAWIDFSSPKHGEASSVRGVRDDLGLEVAEAQRDKLFSTVAPVRYTRPYFYGRWEDYYYLLAFKTREILRFAMSPSGGGQGNPAWDFQILVPEVRVGAEYRLSVRAVVDRWRGLELVERQAQAWLDRDE